MSFTRPSPAELRWARRALEPWRALLDPVFFHMERVPGQRPLMFVGNHTLYGMLDIPHLYFALLDQHDLLLRSMGDRFHFRVPGWGEVLSRFGVVDASREACAELLGAGEPVLVFPGGAREIAKRRGEKYRLLWGTRLGFVKLAIAHGATIVPFAMLGGDDAWDIVWDAEDIVGSAMGPLLEGLWNIAAEIPVGSMPPIVKGLAGTPMPRPVRLYFGIGQPIETARYAGLEDDDSSCFALREEVAEAIYAELAFLEGERAWDPDDASLQRRVIGGLLKLTRRF